MTTTYVNGSAVYSASLNNGTTSTSISLVVSNDASSVVSEEVMDSAANAFLNVINSTISVVSSSKEFNATGISDWSFTAA